MSGKKNMKSKQQSMVDNSSDSKSAEVLSATASTPASTPASTAAPVSSVQKGGRSKKTAPATAVVNATAVVPVPTAATLATTSVVEQTQKGGRKKPSSAPVEASSSDNKTSARGSKAKSVQDKVSKESKKSKESKESKESNDSTESKVPAVKPKVPRKKKPENDAAPSAPDASVLATDVDSNEKHIRSFKVRLPGSETFEGRFTGLTPYQAANKALSKYFREGERTDNDVTFSICESTRKSKKSVYTYVGKRHKLDVPVKYSIQDGREIVKNFKNTLKKVKKSDNGSTQLATETSVSMAH
jgi:hypothetical protein